MCAVRRLSEEERKKEIRNAAAKVIIEKGLEKATMEDVIAGTTLSKGGVYHYYGNVLEIFKDIMISGIDYRNQVIKEQLMECEIEGSNGFMAKQLVDKILDDNPYTTLYIEFLIARKRKPELNHLLIEFQEQTKERFRTVMGDNPVWMVDSNAFQLATDFINAMMLAVDILEVRENFKKNRKVLEKMMLYIFEQGRENVDEGL